jgi:hypothetical protein
MSFIILNWLDEPVLHTGTDNMFDNVARYNTLEEAEKASNDVEDPQIINTLAGDVLLGKKDILEMLTNTISMFEK